jgi:hypothetical protein
MNQLPQVLLVDDNPADVDLNGGRWPGAGIQSDVSGWIWR